MAASKRKKRPKFKSGLLNAIKRQRRLDDIENRLTLLEARIANAPHYSYELVYIPRLKTHV